MHKTFHNDEEPTIKRQKQTQIVMKNFEPFVTKLETHMWYIFIDFLT